MLVAPFIHYRFENKLLYITDCMLIIYLIWLAPRAGKMKRNLCSDLLPERAACDCPRWSRISVILLA